METVSFHLKTDADTALLFYRRLKSRIQVTADDGRLINIPWKHFKTHVTHSGIEGRLSITFDNARARLGLRRLDI